MKKIAIILIMILINTSAQAVWWDCTIKIIDKHWGYDRFNSTAKTEVQADRRSAAEHEAIRFGFYKKGFLLPTMQK